MKSYEGIITANHICPIVETYSRSDTGARYWEFAVKPKASYVNTVLMHDYQ